MQLPARAQSAADALFRVSFSGIFLIAAYSHFTRPEVTVGRLMEAPLAGLATRFASAESLVFLSGVALAAAGVGLMVGLQTRLSALALAAVLLPITLTVHIANPGHLGPLFKNVALMGGLVHFGTRGGGAWSLDALLDRARVPVAGAGAAAALLAAFVWAGGPSPVGAAPADARAEGEAAQRGAVILVQQAAQVPVVLKSAEQLLRDGAPEAHVVACGGAVDGLTEGPALAKARAAGVQVKACGLTLEKKGIDPASLPRGVEAVPNGILEALRLQAKGLLSLAL